MSDDVVLFEEVEARAGRKLAIATLNSEASLNALSLQMVDALQPRLAAWARRDDVACVLLRGAGSRAFCAGGDVQNLYRAIVRNQEVGGIVDTTCEDFFEREYRLDYMIHNYPKPIATLGRGIVMGGGLGILSASSVRIVTPSSSIAIPEVTIGLFPDAGITWILRNLPVHQAVFLGATGSRMNAGDAFFIGLATHAMADDGDPIDQLRRADWNVGLELDDRPNLPASHLEAVDEALARAIPTLPASVDETISALEPVGRESEWAARGVAAMRSGCPTSIGILLEQLRRARAMTLADAYRMELVVACRCARGADFAEGVRALLVDKDNAPRWSEATPRHILDHFVAPWGEHPLADLP